MFIKLSGIHYPIYRYSGTAANFYYAPGYLVKVNPDYIEKFEYYVRNSNGQSEIHQVDQSVRKIVDVAQTAEKQSAQLISASFEPQCLTIYLNQECTLDCQYCFSDLASANNKQHLSNQAIHSALKLVAEYCGGNASPLTVVFHGGGEPILSWKTIDQIQPLLREYSQKNKIPIFRYLSTNGIMSEDRALWLAHNVDVVGLSCDGPPEIQSVQRPIRGFLKHNSSFYVERTGKILAENGVSLHVRVTLTKQSFNRQVEICDYVCQNLNPQSINVELVYLGGKAKNDSILLEEDLECFFQSYLAAKVRANYYGSQWKLSGTRLNEIHMAYCNIFRNVLNLIPGDVATACFKTINVQQANSNGFVIGSYNPITNVFDLNYPKIDKLRLGYQRLQSCEDCFIKHHCTHNCPNGCPLNAVNSADVLCKLFRRIAFDELGLYMNLLGKSDDSISGITIPMVK